MTYKSDFLRNKYDLEITFELGTILELLAYQQLLNKSLILSDDTLVEKFDTYFKNAYVYNSNNSKVYNNVNKEFISHFLSLTNLESMQYFLARWILNNIVTNVYPNNNFENFEKFISENFILNSIPNDTIINIEKLTKNTLYNGFNIKSIKEFLREYINKIIYDDIFLDYNKINKDYIVLFFNLWKVVKSFFTIENPIYDKNKKRFSNILREISINNYKLKCINTYGLNLSYMDFSDMNLAESVLYDVNLKNTNFTNANLDAIILHGSNLRNSNFEHAFMECSDLTNCNCRVASFKDAHMLSSVVVKADFSYANFENTNFMDCDADCCIISGIKINAKTAFNSSDFKYVDWDGVDISGLAISADQIIYFLDNISTKGKAEYYSDKYNKYSFSEIEDLYFEYLCKSLENEFKNIKPTYETFNVFESKDMKIKDNIFISHASEEKEKIAIVLYKDLVKSNHRPWIDIENLKDEKKALQAINSAISNCKTAVIVLSESYIKKAWTRFELKRILEEKQKRDLNIILIQCKIDDKTEFEKYNKSIFDVCIDNKVLIIDETEKGWITKTIAFVQKSL